MARFIRKTNNAFIGKTRNKIEVITRDAKDISNIIKEYHNQRNGNGYENKF